MIKLEFIFFFTIYATYLINFFAIKNKIQKTFILTIKDNTFLLLSKNRLTAAVFKPIKSKTQNFQKEMKHAKVPGIELNLFCELSLADSHLYEKRSFGIRYLRRAFVFKPLERLKSYFLRRTRGFIHLVQKKQRSLVADWWTKFVLKDFIRYYWISIFLFLWK